MGRLTKKDLYEERMMFFSLSFTYPEIVSKISSFREMTHEDWVILLSHNFSFIKYARRYEVNRRDIVDILRKNIKTIDNIRTFYPTLTLTVQEFMKILTYVNNNNSIIRDKEYINKLMDMTKLTFSSYHLSSLIMNYPNDMDCIMEYFGEEIEKHKHQFIYATKIILCANGLYNFDDLTNEDLTSKFRSTRTFRNSSLENAYDVLLKKAANNPEMKDRFMRCFLCKYDGLFTKYTASRYQTYMFSHPQMMLMNTGSETLIKTLDIHFTDFDIGKFIDPNELTDFGIDYYCYRGLVRYVDFSKLSNKNVKSKMIYQIAHRLELDDDMINNVQWNTIKSKYMLENLFYYMYDLGMNSIMLEVYARCNKKYISKDMIRKYGLYRM